MYDTAVEIAAPSAPRLAPGKPLNSEGTKNKLRIRINQY